MQQVAAVVPNGGQSLPLLPSAGPAVRRTLKWPKWPIFLAHTGHLAEPILNERVGCVTKALVHPYLNYTERMAILWPKVGVAPCTLGTHRGGLPTPTGLRSYSPGLRGTSYPGCSQKSHPTLKGLNQNRLILSEAGRRKGREVGLGMQKEGLNCA